MYGVADFNYADVIFGRNAQISINMMKFVSMDDLGNETPKSTKSTRTKSKQDNTEQAETAQPNRESVDPQIWYEQKGRAVLENIISELNSRGHSSLTIKDDGEIYITQADKQVRQARLAGMPEKSKWGKLSKVFHSEGLAAEVKEDPEAPDYARSIEAVILYSHDAFAYWPMKKEGGENVPPVCSSLDGKTGIGLPGGACAQCPFNKYETATDSQGNATKGKACKNMKHLYIVRDGDSMPILFSLPPTSLSSFKEFISKNFALRCRPTYASLVRIGLKKVDGANAYSVATFRLVRDFSGEELVAVKKYATTFREQIKNLTASIVKKAQSESVSNVEYDDLPFYDESAEVENIGNSNIDGDREDIPQ